MSRTKYGGGHSLGAVTVRLNSRGAGGSGSDMVLELYSSFRTQFSNEISGDRSGFAGITTSAGRQSVGLVAAPCSAVHRRPRNASPQQHSVTFVRLNSIAPVLKFEISTGKGNRGVGLVWFDYSALSSYHPLFFGLCAHATTQLVVISNRLCRLGLRRGSLLLPINAELSLYRD